MVFQKHVLPNDALMLHRALDSAANSANSASFLKTHISSNAYAVNAVAIAAFSIFSYFVHAIRALAANIIVLNFKNAFSEFGSNLLKAGKCIVIIALLAGMLAIAILSSVRLYQGIKPVEKLTVEKLKGLLAAKETALLKAQQSIHAASEKQTTLIAQQTTLETQLKKTKGSTSTLHKEKTALEQKVTDVQQKLDTANVENQKLLDFIARLKDTSSKLTSQIVKEKQTHLSQSQAVAQLTAELNTAKSEVTTLRSKFKASLSKQPPAIQQRIKALEDQVQQLTRERDSFEDDFRNCEQELELCEKEVVAQRKTIEEKTANIDALTRDLTKALANLKVKESQVKELDEALAKTKLELTSAHTDHAVLTKQINTLAPAVGELAKQLKAKTDEFLAFEKQRAQLEQNLADTIRENNRVSKERDAAVKQLALETQSVATLRRSTDALAARLAAAEKDNDLLRAQAKPVPAMAAQQAVPKLQLPPLAKPILAKIAPLPSLEQGENLVVAHSLEYLLDLYKKMEVFQNICLCGGDLAKIVQAQANYIYDIHDTDKKVYKLLCGYAAILAHYEALAANQPAAKAAGAGAAAAPAIPNPAVAADIAKLRQNFRELHHTYGNLSLQLEKYNQLVNSTRIKDLKDVLMAPSLQQEIYLKNPASFEAYLDNYCPGVRLVDAKEKCERGSALLHQVLDGKKLRAPSPQDVSDIIWTLMRLSIQKGQGFEEGAFIILDPECRIYNYLMQMPEGAARYKRDSSHTVGKQSDDVYKKYFFKDTAVQNGIDLDDLPADKFTVVFDVLNKGKYANQNAIFIKPENHGTATAWDWMMHAIEFAVSLKNKLVAGADEKPGMRKEHIPAAEKKLFQSITNSLNKTGILDLDVQAFMTANPTKDIWQDIGFLKQPKSIEDALKYGLSHMHTYIKCICDLQKRGFNPAVFQDLTARIQQWNQLVSQYDCMEFRFGREVCFEAEILRKEFSAVAAAVK